MKGFLSTQNNDFIILNKEGINFIRLDQTKSRKSFKEQEGIKGMVHSLPSMDYLKIEDRNMLYFENKLVDDSILIRIQQQHQDESDDNMYEDIFKIKVESTRLDNLILMQSLFLLDTTNEILSLIESQHNNGMFFSSFMELDHANMVQILSFESRVIKKLL